MGNCFRNRNSYKCWVDWWYCFCSYANINTGIYNCRHIWGHPIFLKRVYMGKLSRLGR